MLGYVMPKTESPGVKVPSRKGSNGLQRCTEQRRCRSGRSLWLMELTAETPELTLCESKEGNTGIQDE